MVLAASVSLGQAADFVAAGTKARATTAAVPEGATLFAGYVGDNNGTGTTTPTPLMSISGGTLGNGGSPTWTIRQRGSGSASGSGVAGCMAWAEILPGSGGLTSGQTITVSLDAGAASIVAKDIELWYVPNSRPSSITPVSAFDNTNTMSIAITPTAAGQMVQTWAGREASTNSSPTADPDTTNGAWTTSTPAGLTTAAAGGLAASGVTGWRAEKVVTAAGAQTWDPVITGGGGDWVAFAMVLEERVVERVGTATPSGFKVGATQVDALYLGATRVF